MDDTALLRYSRHILLPQIDIVGQERLGAARVLIVGLGGLGSPVSLYLTASGVGTLVLADGDRVDATNLQRQIVHRESNVGALKVESAAENLAALNTRTRFVLHRERLTGSALEAAVADCDCVVDGSDNFGTRFEVNAACVKHGKPLVSGAVVRFEGQVLTVRPEARDAPCYRCLYPETNEPGEPCSQFGVLAPAAGLIGSIQAAEAIKVLLHIGETLTGRLLLVDVLRMELRTIKTRRDPACPVCGPAPRP